jgi:hypothetical protein
MRRRSIADQARVTKARALKGTPMLSQPILIPCIKCSIRLVTSLRLSGQIVPVALAKQLWYLTAHALPAPMAGGKKATIIEIAQGSPV